MANHRLNTGFTAVPRFPDYTLRFFVGALRSTVLGIRDIRQILNPLRDILHALNRRVLQRERSCSTQECRAVG